MVEHDLPKVKIRVRFPLPAHNMLKEEIVENIKNSKKYKTIYIKTIERIVADCIERFGEKRAEKEAKNLLHQIWGAFYETRPNFKKVISKLDIENLEQLSTSKENLKEFIIPILKLQSSVEERISILPEFYEKIFEITGIPNSIIDHACGLNPLTIPWMNLPTSQQGGPNTTSYKAYDIDSEEIEFLKTVFSKIHCATKTEFALGDVLSDEFKYADVVFMLKLLPCLEHQKKGCSLDILKKQNCKFIVISYPIKSIGGKEKGMYEFYRNNFKNMISSEDLALRSFGEAGWKVTELLFETELVFVIEKPI